MIVKYDTLERFEVKGAGHIEIGNHPHAMCGGSVGFHLAWSDRPGGVIGRSEAIRLANYILDKTKDVTEKEHVEYQRRIDAMKWRS